MYIGGYIVIVDKKMETITRDHVVVTEGLQYSGFMRFIGSSRGTDIGLRNYEVSGSGGPGALR